jgi:hypothetical protein
MLGIDRDVSRPSVTEWKRPVEVIFCNAELEEPYQNEGPEEAYRTAGAVHGDALAHRNDVDLWTRAWDM